MNTAPLILPDRFEAAEAMTSTPFERTLRAFDRVLQRYVLLKLPGAEIWDGWSTSIRERTLREARALAKVRHAGIVPIHWVEETAYGPLLVLDLPEGESLQDRLAAGPLGIDAVRELGIQLAEALGAVHYNGIVHRAVSVESVRVLADDTVRLGTFTFAKCCEGKLLKSSIDHLRRSEPLVAAFLPRYVAPEQLAGQGADQRTDVWALGCLLFRCLSGRDPFTVGDDVEAMPDLRKLRPEVPKDVCEVLRRCTRPVREARYPTAQAVAEALRATHPDAVAQRGWPSRRTLLAAGVGASILVGLAFWRGRGDEGSARWNGSQDVAASDSADTYAARYGKCHALLIGIADAYRSSPHPALHNPVREVEAVRDRLLANDREHWAGTIDLLKETDANKEAILQQLERLQRVPSEDAVLLYYSGHGVKDGKQYFLVPAGTTSTDTSRDPGYLSEGILANFLERCQAKHVLVVLDCCYGGTLFSPMKGHDADAYQNVVPAEAAPFLRHRARQIIASASSEAADGAGMSRFCESFLHALTPAPAGPFRGFVQARVLHGHIVTWMAAHAASRTQEPVIMHVGPADGSFVFFLPQ